MPMPPDNTNAYPKAAATCAECGQLLIRINGRVLREGESGSRSGAALKTNAWYTVCSACMSSRLRTRGRLALPFLCSDGTIQTLEDSPPTAQEDSSAILDFCGFHFSSSALSHSMELIRQEDPRHTEHSTAAVEAAGGHYLDARSPAFARHFSDLVCQRGGSGRVWGNLKRHHGHDLGNYLQQWLQTAANAANAKAAITPAVGKKNASGDTGITGLGVSFPSKHLRMLRPKRYAVLDDVLSQGLGFALNAKGYALFMRQPLQFQQGDFKKALGQQQPTVAKVELDIFGLVREHVRSKSNQPPNLPG